MVNPEKQQSISEREIENIDRVDGSNGDGIDDLSSVAASSSVVEASAIGISGITGGSRQSRGSGGEMGLTDRLTDILVDGGDGDLLLQRSDREATVMQWLQALDMQVMGACRANERLKPLLKLNVSSGVAEDRLLAHLSQHFEPSEVGKLARCLCIPLVSVRVGKINKQGTRLCPTATRGNLNLTLSPTSDLRISFIGDDGHIERLATLSSDSQCSAVAIEEIPGDKSGRSFLIKITDGEFFYFWCSEKSKLLGDELFEKMKDLLNRKPSVAELTGICESRLDCFAIHLRAYLVGSTVTNTQASSVLSTTSSDASTDSPEFCQNAQSSSVSSKPSRSRHPGSQGAKLNSLCQGILSPRPSSFKDGLPRTLSSLRSVAREKLKRRGDSHLSCVDNPSVASSSTTNAYSLNHLEKDKLPEASGTRLLPPSSFLESLGKSADPPFLSPASEVPSMGSSLFSPYYCWCPPVTSTLQYAVAPPKLPILSTESLSLPPLSSLLSTVRPPSLLTSKPPLNHLAEAPSLDFPPFLPEPLVRLPLSMPISQQIPTFTPLMCDPIVHIPVIDICSSGPGYLVSAGPAISTSIPPLYPKLMNPLIPETDSVGEKGARETLRLLISSSSQTSTQLMDIFPSVLTGSDENPAIFAVGSRGLYSGTRDVDAIASSIAAMGLVTLSERAFGGSVIKRCISEGESVDKLEKPGGCGGSSSDDGGSIL